MADAGCRVVQVPASHLSEAFSLVVLYPSVSPEGPTPIGPYVVSVALDGVAASGQWPVVVISHGSGGSGLTHRDLARHLARHGFLVLVPEHPGNNRDDNHLANTAAILEQRPLDVTAALDWAGSAAGWPRRADLRRVGIVGHSLGGYTALALGGGRPTAFARETPDGRPQVVAVTPDPRVAALVLLAPAAPWFLVSGALSARSPAFASALRRAGHERGIPARAGSPGLRSCGLPRHALCGSQGVPGAAAGMTRPRGAAVSASGRHEC